MMDAPASPRVFRAALAVGVLAALGSCGLLIGLPSSVGVTDDAGADASSERRREGGPHPLDASDAGGDSDADLLRNVVDYCLGFGYACAIVGDSPDATTGRVACWGATKSACDGGPVARPTIVLDASASVIACGHGHTCAIVPDPGGGGATLTCWGDNRFGAVTGAIDVTDCDHPPTTFSPPKNAIPELVATGDEFTCATFRSLLGNSTMQCWGANGAYQAKPPAVVADAGTASITHVVAGTYYACATVEPGPSGVYCWGANPLGGLDPPDGARGTQKFTAIDGSVNLLQAGTTLTCVRTAEAPNVLACGGVIVSSAPVTCAPDSGTSSSTDFEQPVGWVNGAGGDQLPVVGASLGDTWGCLLLRLGDGGAVGCIGDNSSCQIAATDGGYCVPGTAPHFVPLDATPTEIQVSRLTHCYDTDASDIPGRLPGYEDDSGCLARARCRIAGKILGTPWASAFSCARVNASAGSNLLYCWGSNSQAELGRGVAGPPSPAPRPVIGLAR